MFSIVLLLCAVIALALTLMAIEVKAKGWYIWLMFSISLFVWFGTTINS